MVLQKRREYGFNGYQVPAIPRATRSVRRSPFKKKVEDNQQSAFDLLATVAGSLLLEGEEFPASGYRSSGRDHSDFSERAADLKLRIEENSSRLDHCDQRSVRTTSIGPELCPQPQNHTFTSKEVICTQNNACSDLASVVTSDCPERVGHAEKLSINTSKHGIGAPLRKEVGFSGFGEPKDLNLVDEPQTSKIKVLQPENVSFSNGVDQYAADDPVVLNGRPPAPLSSDSSAKRPPCREHTPCFSFPACRDNVNLGSRDDDENSSGCTQPSTSVKTFRQPSRIIDRRVRKLLSSKYWKLNSNLRKGPLSRTDGDLKPVYCKRKYCYKGQRSQRVYPFKKRRLYDFSSASSSDGGTSNDEIFGMPRKCIDRDAPSSRIAMHGGTGISSSVGDQHVSSQSRDSHVKLRIKSFRVPELIINVQETATVGSLKRTVMEAVTAILGGGLRVGVLLRGKKIRDDNRTLLQTGISRDNKLDALGFTLEPNSSQLTTSLGPEGHHPPITCDAPQPLLRYSPSNTSEVQRGASSDLLPEPPLTNMDKFIESDHDSAPSPSGMSIDKSATGSRALIAIPPISVEALAVVPMQQKAKRPEIVQRRIRRPFSVSEVEALVQAVENLGTGRWRDVKLQAFDNAKHRTYVDLKDKWKTLVHTAKISPQQRRGEPVPQELLDRVLAAHAYWSQQQAKQLIQQQKQDPHPDTCLLL